MLCEYNCGNEAIYPPHKGTPKWCCESHWTRCPTNKKINSESKKGSVPWNKGIKQTKNAKDKQRNTMIKKWKTYDYRKKQKTTRESEKYKNHMKSIRTGNLNPMFGKTLSDEHMDSLKLNVSKIKERYPTFYKIEKIRMNNGFIEVKCKYCSEWFKPHRYQLYERIRQIESKHGNMKNFLYCCSDHKFLCPYSNRVFPNTLKKYEIYRRQVLIKSNESLKNNILKDIEKRGKDFHLDHKFSIIEGFKQDIDPVIIGHIKNLQIIPSYKNIKKSGNCSLSLEELLKLIGD